VCRKAGEGHRQQQVQASTPCIEVNEEDWELLAIAAAADVDGDDGHNDIGFDFHSLSSTPVSSVTPPSSVSIPTAAVLPIPPGKQVNRWAPTTLLHYDFGVQHPDYKKPVKRATWTAEEKDWILSWIKAHPDQVTGHARCLKDIQADAAARAIFHPIHVLDGARLRAGFDAAVKGSVV
jgi:hypothetical protein